MSAVGPWAAPPPHGPMAGQSPSRGRQGLRGADRTAPAWDCSCSALWSRPLGTTAAAPCALAWKPTLQPGAPTVRFLPAHQPLRTHTGPPEAEAARHPEMGPQHPPPTTASLASGHPEKKRELPHSACAQPEQPGGCGTATWSRCGAGCRLASHPQQSGGKTCPQLSKRGC